MGNTSDYKRNGSAKKPLNHINLGLLAHVDAGKTTLSEAVLYLTGQHPQVGPGGSSGRFPGHGRHGEGQRDYHIFQAGGIRPGRMAGDFAGHPGPRRFFPGDGTDSAGAGLRSAGNQRGRWSSGAGLHPLEAAEALPGAGFFCLSTRWISRAQTGRRSWRRSGGNWTAAAWISERIRRLRRCRRSWPCAARS